MDSNKSGFGSPGRKTAWVAAAVLGLPVVCTAQMFKTAAAPEISRLDRLVGAWKGTGTQRVRGDETIHHWVGYSQIKKVLGGHFVQQDLVVRTVSGDSTRTASMRIVYGWDAEQKDFVALTLGPDKPATIAHGAVDQSTDTAVFTCAQSCNGTPEVARWTCNLASTDRHTVRVETATGAGPWVTCLEGTFDKTTGGDLETMERQPMEASLKESSKRALDFMIGTWRVSGKVCADPEKPLIRIAGTKTVRPICDGTALAVELRANAQGDRDNVLEMSTYYVWDPQANRYDCIWLSNCGQLGRTCCVHVDNEHVVMASSGVYHGKPMSQQTVISKRMRGGKVDKIGMTRTVRFGVNGSATDCELEFQRT